MLIAAKDQALSRGSGGDPFTVDGKPALSPQVP